MSGDNEHTTPSDTSPPPAKVPARREKHHHPAATNTSVEYHRQAILERAGFTPDVIAEIARESITVLRDGLTAVKRTVHTFRGQVVDVTEEPDHGVRGKSAERLMSILGVDARPHNVQAPVVIQEAETLNLILNIGNGQTVTLGTGSTAPPRLVEEDVIDVEPHTDHNGRPLS